MHWITLRGMKRPRLIRLPGSARSKPDTATAEAVDQIIHRILKQVKKGQTAVWPGLGRFKLGESAQIEFEDERKAK